MCRERSGRDIRSYTWQIWKGIYQTKFGNPNSIDVPELPLHDIDGDLILDSTLQNPGQSILKISLTCLLQEILDCCMKRNSNRQIQTGSY